MPFDSAASVNENTIEASAQRLGKSLRAARQSKKISQQALAALAGLNLATVRGLERGAGTLGPLLAVLRVLDQRFVDQPSSVQLGKWIASARRARGHSQSSAAAALGVSKPTIIQTERGRGNLRVGLLPLLRFLDLRTDLTSQADDQIAFRLINGDCIDVMQTLPANSVDLIVTSPPYMNVGMPYGDTFASEADYLDFSRRWMEAAARLVKPYGSMWVNVGVVPLDGRHRPPLSYLLWPLVREIGLTFQQEIVWQKPSGLPHHHRFTIRSERWMWLTKVPQSGRKRPHTFNIDDVRGPAHENRSRDPRNHPLGKNPGDVWEFAPVNGMSAAKAHPCPFPQPMIERIIRSCSHANDVVLDPFAGSGTTGIAALTLRREAWLIERVGAYCHTIQNRIRDLRASSSAR